MIANEREEARPDRHGHAPAEGHNRADEGNEDVRHPTVDAPVVNCHENGLLRTMRIRWESHFLDVVVIRTNVSFPAGGLAVEIEWLGNTEVVEADGDAAGEEERKPGEIAKTWPLIFTTKAEVAILGDEADHDEHEAPDVLSADVEPGEVLCHPRLRKREVGADLASFTIRNAPDAEAPEDDDGEQRTDPIETEAPGLVAEADPARADLVKGGERERELDRLLAERVKAWKNRVRRRFEQKEASGERRCTGYCGAGG
eukprot:scaffold129052_cov32-Tisochrysis_lutea.AAC.1